MFTCTAQIHGKPIVRPCLERASKPERPHKSPRRNTSRLMPNTQSRTGAAAPGGEPGAGHPAHRRPTRSGGLRPPDLAGRQVAPSATLTGPPAPVAARDSEKAPRHLSPRPPFRLPCPGRRKGGEGALRRTERTTPQKGDHRKGHVPGSRLDAIPPSGSELHRTPSAFASGSALAGRSAISPGCDGLRPSHPAADGARAAYGRKRHGKQESDHATKAAPRRRGNAAPGA